MTAKRKMVTAVFRDAVEVQTAYDGLINRGYRADEINILMSDATRASYFATDRREPAPTGNAAA